MSEFYEINENVRIVAETSSDGENNPQFIIGDIFGLVTLSRHGFREYLPYGYDGATAADYLSETYVTYSRQETRLKAFARDLSLRGYKTAVVTLQGYSQGEWADAVIFTKEEIDFGGLVENVRTWWRGDVYDLFVQYRKIYTATDGATIERWEDVEDTRNSLYLLEYGDLTEEIAGEYWADVRWQGLANYEAEK